MRSWFAGAAVFALAAGSTAADSLPENHAAAEGATIGKITLRRANIFDLSDPDENKALFRLANRLHALTRASTIDKQLLFRTGEIYSQRLVDETERILRSRKYIYDADIRPARVANGVVDVEVATRDIWSLLPQFGYSRSGGADEWTVGLEDSNLLGRGQLLNITYEDDVDRSSRSIHFSDAHVGRNWVSLSARYADNSDGESSALSVERPFYALDTRRAAGSSVSADERRSTLYLLGDEAAEFGHRRDYGAIWAGWSPGVRKATTRRWTVGLVYDDNRFSPTAGADLRAVVPADRKLVYPFLGFEFIDDAYTKTRDHDRIGLTEDFHMGRHINARLGWSDESFGAGTDALVYSVRAGRGFGKLESTSLFVSLRAGGRIESGQTRNATLSVDARYYRRQSSHRLLYVSLRGTAGSNLDTESPVYLGGDSGLRGFPLRYQSGDSRIVATVEQRYFTDWYPFRIMRVGAALFADVGHAWGPNPAGPETRKWLSNVGFGLRFAPTRFAARRIFHLDIAFPLNADASIDSVQVLFSAKRSF